MTCGSTTHLRINGIEHMDEDTRDTLPGWRFSCDDEPTAWDDKLTLFASEVEVVVKTKDFQRAIPIYVLSELLRRSGYVVSRRS